MATKATILGSGSMATACAILLADHRGQSVTIWGRNPQYTQEIQQTRENRRLLPGVRLPDNVTVTSDIRQAVDETDSLVLAIPTRYVREMLESLAGDLPDRCPLISVVKGIENETFLRPSQIVTDLLGERPVVALGGPSHAEEIARGLPATVVAASDDADLARQVQQMFSTDRFRVYTNTDLVGVELAGALKNVIAIAAGIGDGLGYGDNAKAALMTRGIVEITRFGCALGSDPATFHGLAGIGDLITTCVSPHGRNRSVGERLGRGEPFEEISASMPSVAEGVNTTASVVGMAAEHGIEMPITREVFAVLFENKSPVEATTSLMVRPPREE